MGPVASVGLEVVLPVVAYFGPRCVGRSALFALALSTVVSGLVMVGEVVVRRRAGVLTWIVSAGLAVSLVGGLVSRSEVVLYLRDPATDVVIALVAVLGGLRGRPFVAAIRRDLSPSRDSFDERWDASSSFRRAHRVASWWWVWGLLALAGGSVLLLFAVPFDVAVGVSQVFGAVVIGGLIVLGEVIVRSQGVKK